MNKLLKWIAGIAFFGLICCGLNYLLVRDDPWYRILFHSYEQQKKIDNLFIGSSHVYCDVNPDILDELSGKQNFNLATPGQRWDDSYYLVRDAVSRFDIEHLYLECYSWNLTEYETWIKDEKTYRVVDYIDDPENYPYAWQITDAMKPGVNTAAMLFHSADADHMLESMFPFTRFRTSIFDKESLHNNIEEKQSENYREYIYQEEMAKADGTSWYIEYREKGYFYSNGCLLDSEKLFRQVRDFNKNGIGEKSGEYLRKILDFCRGKGIAVTLFVAPVYELQLLSTENYDKFHLELKELSAEYDVPLYDFNLIKNEFLDLHDSSLYMDCGHLNGRGAEQFTSVLWEVMNTSENENIEKFYRSYGEKISNAEPQIYGLYFTDLYPNGDYYADGTPVHLTRRYKIAFSTPEMECRVYRSTPEGITEISVRMENGEGIFELPVGELGTAIITGEYPGGECSLSVELK